MYIYIYIYIHIYIYGEREREREIDSLLGASARVPALPADDDAAAGPRSVNIREDPKGALASKQYA